MKLNIKNFAKINEANIIIDGITVIAGENNTGKSTIGKILFTLFHAWSDIEERIWNERFNEIENTNRIILQKHLTDAGFSKSKVFVNARNTARRITLNLRHKLKRMSFSEEYIRDSIERAIEGLENVHRPEEPEDWKDLIDELSLNTIEILFIPEEVIARETISRYFDDVFHGQINSLTQGCDEDTVLSLEIRGKRNQVLFRENQCAEFTDEIGISHQAIYIDNPFLVDELSKYNDLNPMNQLLKNLLTNDRKEYGMDGVIETVRAKEKLNDIFKTLENVVDGEIVTGRNGDDFYLKGHQFDEPISFYNLSTGMKSFVILKMLIEKGCIREKDVIILDEPEIHLHPQWQIAYAELIVLLQKQFDLSVVVTTHSPYFVDAINLFSCKYEIDSKVHYYLSSNVGNTVKMDDVTRKIDLIYQKMASPIQMLNTLRYELNNQ